MVLDDKKTESCGRLPTESGYLIEGAHLMSDSAPGVQNDLLERASLAMSWRLLPCSMAIATSSGA